MNSVDRVVLLEFPDEVDAYMDQCRRDQVDPASSWVVSIDPTAQLRLQQYQVKSSNSLPYFTSASHERALRKSHELLVWLETRVQLEDKLGIKGAYTNALQWYSRYFIHEMLWLCEILAEVHCLHPGASLSAAPGIPGGSGVPRLQPEERYLGVMADDCCRRLGLSFRPIDYRPPVPQSGRPPGHPGWLGRIGYAIGATLHRRVVRRMGRQHPLLVLSHAYRMDDLVGQVRNVEPQLPWAVLGEKGGAFRTTEMLRRALEAVTVWSGRNNGRLHLGEVWLGLLERATQEDRAFLADLENAMTGLAKEVEGQGDLFSHRGIPFGTYYANKIRFGIIPAMRRLHREVLAWDEILSLLQPRMIVAPFGRRDSHALGDLTNHRGIPGLLISHASFTPTKCDLEEMAWGFHGYGMLHGSFSHAALQTPLAEAFSKQLTSNVRFVITGPLIWGRSVDRATSKKLKARMLAGREHCRVVVHAGTPHGRGSQHFHVYETMDEYIAALSDLIMAVEQIPDTFLIIKAKSTPLSRDDLRAMLPVSDRYYVSVDEPFLDVLGFSDLLVSLSSTTIEEALQNQVPVLLYGGQGRYQHVSALEVTANSKLEPHAVYSVKKQEHLAAALKRILECIGKPQSPMELFQQYIYKPEKITPFPELLRQLVKN